MDFRFDGASGNDDIALNLLELEKINQPQSTSRKTMTNGERVQYEVQYGVQWTLWLMSVWNLQPFIKLKSVRSEESSRVQ